MQPTSAENKHSRCRHEPRLRAVNYLEDLIGVNLLYAVDGFDWDDMIPVTTDGVTVADFCHRNVVAALPPFYCLHKSGAYLIRSPAV